MYRQRFLECSNATVISTVKKITDYLSIHKESLTGPHTEVVSSKCYCSFCIWNETHGTRHVLYMEQESIPEVIIENFILEPTVPSPLKYLYA